MQCNVCLQVKLVTTYKGQRALPEALRNPPRAPMNQIQLRVVLRENTLRLGHTQANE